jgi:hypothetical protein
MIYYVAADVGRQGKLIRRRIPTGRLQSSSSLSGTSPNVSKTTASLTIEESDSGSMAGVEPLSAIPTPVARFADAAGWP